MADEPSRPQSSTTKPKNFKPRAGIVRKSKAERDEYARQEAERAATRAAVSEQSQPKAGGAQAPKHGKGARDNKQRDARDYDTGAGSGVLGASTAARPSQNRRAQDVGRSELVEGQDAVKPEDSVKTSIEGKGHGEKSIYGGSGGGAGGGGGRAGGQTREEDDFFDISRETDTVSRRDIEFICISDDEELVDEEAVEGDEDTVARQGKVRKGKARASSDNIHNMSLGLRPVMAPRFVARGGDKVGASEGKKPEKRVKSSRTVQGEADDYDSDEDEMHVDPDVVTRSPNKIKKDPPSSPELGKKKPVRREHMKTRDAKLAAETAEERAERLRLKKDVNKLKDVLIPPLQLKTGVSEEAMEIDGASELSSSTEPKLLLFQLPPLIPFLTNSEMGQPRPTSPVVSIKRDPDGPSVQTDLTKQGDAAVPRAPEISEDTVLTAEGNHRLPAGRVGKLHVHKSGKVSLDWGGVDMEVRFGTQVDFIQDIVLVDTPNASTDDTMDSDRPKAVARTYALGPVQQKMVVIPDWQKLYE